MRMLVLEGTGLVIPDHAIALIEATSPERPAPRLLELLGSAPAGASTGPLRVLRLSKGGGVEVPALMRMVDDIEVLPLPHLLARTSKGVIGVAEFANELLLVCDPNLLVSGGAA